MLDFTPPQKQPPLSHTKKLDNKQFNGYLKSHTDTAQLLFSIEKYLQAHLPFYLDSLLSQLKGQSISAIKQKLENQYKALSQGKSFFHLINNCISARKKCLNKIIRDLTKSGKILSLFPQQYYTQTQQNATFIEWVEIQGYSVVDVDQSVQQSIKVISNIFADMARLRQMTVYLVEQIHKWKVRIENHLDRCQQHTQIKFYHEESQVYEMILEDSNFIWSSKLTNYIWLEAKQDPFIIRNVITIQQKPTKTLLQKYFLQLLYPKDEEIIDKAVRCFQMLAFKFTPKVYNRFQEEQLLIQNYLQIQMNAQQFVEPQERPKMTLSSEINRKQEDEKNSPIQSDQSPSKKRNPLNVRGWVFQKKIEKPTRQRINEIIQTHKKQMHIIKPFNIANYAQKNSIALAYLSEVRKSSNKKERGENVRKFPLDREEKNFMSEGEEKKQEKRNDRGLESQPEIIRKRKGSSLNKMFRSVTKLNPIIYEDPKQQLPDTPKEKQRNKQTNLAHFNSSLVSFGKEPSLRHIKINSMAVNPLTKQEFNSMAVHPLTKQEQAKIEVEEEEVPLNLAKFYQVFRADTNKPKKSKDNPVQDKRKIEIDNKSPKNQKPMTVKQFLENLKNSRTQRAKSMQLLPYTRKPIKLSLGKKQVNKSKSKSLQKSSDQYKKYTKVKIQPKLLGQKNRNQIKKTHLILKAKRIPYDLVQAYVKHLQSKRPAKSRIFSDFDTKNIIKKLTNPFVHSIIFDIIAQNQISVGTIVLSESQSGRGGKLKYLMQFMSVQPFQLVSVAMLRVAQELLSSTPCQQVIYPLVVDRLDIVSSQFIDLIDADLTEGVHKFGRLDIMDRQHHSLTGTDIRQRMYVFTSDGNEKVQKDLGLKMMGNYRSLKFQCKCLVMISNFRLGSDTIFKDTLNKYQKVAIGQLFAHTFMKIMTKYHLKQLRQASFGGEGELGELVRKDSFLRSILHAELNDLKDNSEDFIKTTDFTLMDEALKYLKYKKYDQHFEFKFLEQSRFIPHHEVILTELDQEISLQFTLTSNQQLFMIHNHKHHQIHQINFNSLDTSAYLLPTTNEKIDLFIMSASNYVQSSTDQTDLYSYITYLFSTTQSKVYRQISSIVLPNLGKQGNRISKVRMFDGFYKLFPEKEFYSAAMINCINHWQSYYADAVIHEPGENSIAFEYPFFLGFYDKTHKSLLAVFLYQNCTENSEES